MTLDLRSHFSIFRGAAPRRIHLAAHSHHFWPDRACAAHANAVAEAARSADNKWTAIFADLIPRVQRGIARVLNLPDARTIAVAPNTHELLCRLISALPIDRPPRILTSDSEFHSFERQIARLQQENLVCVERVPTQPSENFPERFCAAAARQCYELVFVSQVFFNSGASAGELEAIVTAVHSPDTFIVIDGYHGFMALPTDLSRLAARAFYLAGGYKYAMAGEGVCFLHCPPGYAPRPRDTGWFAGFGELSEGRGPLAYAPDGSRFLGATFDPSGLHRLAAVFDWMDEIGLSVAAIHEHVMALQAMFLAAIDAARVQVLRDARLVTPIADSNRGHFLTFEIPQACSIHDRLAALDIVTDVRGSRIRFGFGCYHAADEIVPAVDAIARAPAT